MNKREIVRAIRAERTRTVALLRPLPAERFDLPTALPGWRIREVVAHLITTDRASVTGSILPHVLRSTDHLERWNDRAIASWADRPVGDLLIALDRWGRRFDVLARAIPGPVYRLTVPTMYGKGPVGLLVWARVFDEWVHRQDIRRALGMPDEEVDLEAAAEFVQTVMGTHTLPRLEGATGRVAVALSRAAVPEWVYDLGAGTSGPEALGEPDARIHVPASAFVMAAAGRETFAQLEERGELKIEGDEAPARRLLARVRIV